MSPISHISSLVSRALAIASSDGSLPQQSLDLSTYPTTSLQQFGFFIIFFFPALAFFIVSLRIYGRVSTKTFGWDDGFIIAATLMAVVEAAFTFIMMKMQYVGVHIYQLPTAPYDTSRSLLVNYIVVIFYNPELALVKSSVLFFLLRLGGHDNTVRYSIHVLNTVNLILMVSVFIASVFTCVPIHKYWHPATAGHCNNEALQYIITSSITVVTDVLVMIIPIKLVVGLQMNRKAKAGLISVLCAGIIVIVFSILRLHSIAMLYYGTPSADPTYAIDFVYSTVECNLAIISASIPALYGLLKRWFPRIFAGSTKPSEAFTPYDGTLPGSYALQTIGGSSMRFKSLKSGVSGSKRVRVNSLTASEEEMIGKNEIHKTTEVSVVFAS